jgi:hypothetical protein
MVRRVSVEQTSSIFTLLLHGASRLLPSEEGRHNQSTWRFGTL